MNFQILRNGFVVGSLGVSFGGFIALFTPYNQFSQFFIASGLGSLGASSLAIQQSEKISKRKSKKFLTEIETLKLDTEHFSKLLQDKHQELVKATEERDQYLETGNLVYECLEQVKEELALTKEALQDTRDIHIDAAVTTLKESLEEAVKQVNALIPFLVKKYPDVKSNCQELAAQFNQDVSLMSAQIGVISDNNSLSNEDLISSCLAVQHEIILKGSSIKAKLYKAACDHLQRQLFNVIPLTEHEEKIGAIKDYYSRNLKAIQEEFSQVADSCINAYKSDFHEVVNDGLAQSQDLEKLQNEIISLNGKLQDLSKPLQLVGTSEAARVGNSIINYYHSKLGITLDGLDFNSTDAGYKLLFHLSRNNRFIDTATLNDGNNPDKIKELSGALNTPKFSQSERSNYVSLDIELRKVEKKTATIEDIRRLIEPSAKFGDVVRRYHESKPTLRVMTRTGGGKGIAVKNLLHHYVNNLEGWELWLSDPQHGSSEDYWNCPKIAKSPTEASNILELFINEFTDRKNNQSFNSDISVMGIFDECDKTFDRKQKAGIAQVWTEIRHRKMKLVLVGQSGEVGKQGWTWDEMNNCSLMFIGDAIGTAIKHADDMGWSQDMKTKIPSTYAKVSEFFSQKNNELPVKNQYRFCLLVDGMRYDFVEIPPALEGSFDNNLSWLVSSPWQSKALSQGEDVACVHCGSLEVKKNGKAGDRQRYKCSECGKGFTA